MRASAISAGLFGFAREANTTGQDVVAGQKKAVAGTASFATERFASEQIRGLVRQVFLSASLPVRQVVFTAIQPEIDASQICCKVGQALVAETAKDVVIVTRVARPELRQSAQPFDGARNAAKHEPGGLWLLELSGGNFVAESLHRRLTKIRHEFEYSLIATSPGAPDDAALIGQVSDGIVLVVSATRTRRAVAVRFRNALAQSRLLGTVLIDREFPVPAAIYKRL